MSQFFTKITQGFLKSRFIPRRRSDVIVIGIGLLSVLLTALLAVGGYALYLSYAADAVVPAPSAPAAAAFKEQDIDAALEVLSEREEALQTLLSGGSPQATMTASPPQ